MVEIAHLNIIKILNDSIPRHTCPINLLQNYLHRTIPPRAKSNFRFKFKKKNYSLLYQRVIGGKVRVVRSIDRFIDRSFAHNSNQQHITISRVDIYTSA